MLLRSAIAVVFSFLVSAAHGESQKEIVAEFIGKDISPAQLVVTMERTMCLGSCPSYRVTITGTGDVEYEGFNCVWTRGVKRGTVPPETALGLVNSLLHVRFFDAPSEYAVLDEIGSYDGRLTLGSIASSDHQSTYLQLKLGQHEKRVLLYDHYPTELGAILAMIDKAVDIERWIGTSCERRRESCPLAPAAHECEPRPAPLRHRD
jgi:hypothetical protein